jgi:hypothetical protein
MRQKLQHFLRMWLFHWCLCWKAAESRMPHWSPRIEGPSNYNWSSCSSTAMGTTIWQTFMGEDSQITVCRSSNSPHCSLCVDMHSDSLIETLTAQLWSAHSLVMMWGQFIQSQLSISDWDTDDNSFYPHGLAVHNRDLVVYSEMLQIIRELVNQW